MLEGDTQTKVCLMKSPHYVNMISPSVKTINYTV